jgi:hypothetical protein
LIGFKISSTHRLYHFSESSKFMLFESFRDSLPNSPLEMHEECE